MTLISIPDFAGDNKAHSILDLLRDAGMVIPAPPTAKALIFREISGGATSSRIGDLNVKATQGIPFSSTDSVLLPSVAVGDGLTGAGWELSKVFIWAANGDTLSVSFVPF